MALNSALATGLTQQVIYPFFALQVRLPGGDINLLDQSMVAAFQVNGTLTTFTGTSETYGSWSACSPISESLATEAPSLEITLLPPSTASLGALAHPTVQGAPVLVWFGLLNPNTGTVVGEPELVFSGRLDVAKITMGANNRSIEISVASVFDRLFVVNEGDKLTDTFHQSVWPGERGLELGPEAKTPPVWGA